MIGHKCDIKGCTRAANGLAKRDICGTHYQHFLKYGDYNIQEPKRYRRKVKGTSVMWNPNKSTRPGPSGDYTAAPSREWFGRIKQNIFFDRLLATPLPGATLIL